MGQATKQMPEEKVQELNLSLHELCLACELKGYGLTPHRFGQLVLSGDMDVPKDGQLGETHMRKAIQECEKRRWWLPDFRQHDEVRTPAEKQQCHEFMTELQDLVCFMQNKPWYFVLHYLTSEPSLEIRRKLRVLLNRKLRTEGVDDDK